MLREPTATYDDDEEIFEVASEFDDPVVRKYAAVLRDAHVTLKSFERPTIAQELVKAGIPDIPAADIAEAFRKDLARGSVGVFWDLENVGLPTNIRPMEALTALRDVIMRKFGDIKEFKAYVDLAVFAKDFSPDTRVLFRDCGVEMVDAPHNRRKEVADKHIIVDALWFALHAKDPIVCLISGDSDFSPLLSKLKMNGIPTIVISTAKHVRSLRQQSRWALSWPEDFISSAEPPRDIEQRNRSGPNAVSSNFTGGNSGYSARNNYNFSGTQQYNQTPPPSYSQTAKVVSTSPRRTSPSSLQSPSPRSAEAAAAKGAVERLSPSRLRTAASPPSVDGGTPGPQMQIPAQPQQASFDQASSSDLLPPSDAATTAEPSEAETYTSFEDLEDCIHQVKREVGMPKVRRSAVGILFKRINPVVPFKKIVTDAEAAGLVQIGGELGHAWIALKKDLNEDDLQPPASNSAGSVAPQSGGASQQASTPASGWWITLRYNRSFAAFQTLKSFRPETNGVNVIRVQEPQGTWYRMGIGPFSSVMEADNYYTMHFGELQLLPKVTQQIKKYVDPSMFQQQPSS